MTQGVSGFDGRTALVTGAASGIGEAIARRLVNAGADVILADINLERAESVAASLGNRALARRLDVTDDAAAGALVDEIVERFGKLDMAVNNAGIGSFVGLIHEDPLDNWRRTLSVNLDGVFHCLRHELRAMVKQQQGAIVNMASVMGFSALPNLAGYVAAKHGVIGLTKAAALEYSKSNIRVNAVCPGFVQTPMINNTGQEAIDMAVTLHPLGRLGTATEIAEVTAFLLSDQASFITGSAHMADGGYTAQ
ncbi:MAG: SDR family NAD(P)-dependent oxidoreductase [Caulobacterales bacterium]